MQTEDALRSRPTRWWLAAASRMLRGIALGRRERDPAATLDRFFTSQHVKDLRVIVAIALCAVMGVVVLGLMFTLESELASYLNEKKESWHLLRAVHHFIKAISTFFTFFAPVLAAFGALVAWAYQTGSARLGVVDLFACEISTLCRVITVTDAISRLERRFKRADVDAHQEPASKPAAEAPPGDGAGQFTSQEDYFPVFAGNSRDLQTLEAKVVINITAFYTFMKAMRDSMRAMNSVGAASTASGDALREAARNVVYMGYLGLESARHAIVDLVEFEPEQAERTVIVLISELKAYRFLRGRYTDKHDSHFHRLNMREPEYRDLVPRLCATIEQGEEKEAAMRTRLHWRPAWLLLPQLRDCYEQAVNPERATAAASDADQPKVPLVTR